MVFFLVRRELSGGVAVNALIAVAGTGYQVADIFHAPDRGARPEFRGLREAASANVSLLCKQFAHYILQHAMWGH